MALTVVAALALAACGDDDEPALQTTTSVAPPATVPGARAELTNAQAQPVGEVTFTERDAKVVVEANLRGLPPGFHGFHIHAVGKCEAPFTSAGGHLTLGTQAHPVHAGDQPVLLVAANGTAETRFATDRYKLSDLLPPDGRAMIVHAGADNYGNVPSRYAPAIDQMTKDTGDAGERLGCGVIRRP
ncbi:MAG: superoxide dismutase family protein [Actinomycetota bacterium]|nr:superoxide dismutase family protein [Actinomycetota bacterium]